MPRSAYCWLLLLLLVVALSAGTAASAAIVELRLVPFDQPDVLVDKLEKQRPITNPVSTEHGVEMQKIGVDYTGWARNVLLDGKPVFERYHEGKYIDRLPVARPDLAPGDHTLWPGNHVFTVAADGSVTSKSGELIVSPGTAPGGAAAAAGPAVVKIKLYPVTLRAFLANPDEADLPLTMRIMPLPNLTVREAGEGKNAALELLPVFDKFAPLTLWLPANTEGKGYLVYPVGLTFQLGANGVLAGAGGGQGIEGLRVEKNLIEVPLHGYPIVGDVGARAVVTGVEEQNWREREGGDSKSLLLYPRSEPFEFLITKPGPALALTTGGFAFKSLRVDIPNPATGAQRATVTELASRHFAPGEVITARVRAIDATPAYAANQAEAKARRAVTAAARDLQAAQTAAADAEKTLQAVRAKADSAAASTAAASPAASAGADSEPEDPETAKQEQAAAKQKLAAAERARDEADAAVQAATLAGQSAKAAQEAAGQEVAANSAANPLEKAPAFAQLLAYGSQDWQDLPTAPAAGADGEIKVTLPANAANGVYRLRLGVRAGETAPLFSEQWISIATPQAVGAGLFTARGRDAFYRGEAFWIGLCALAKEPIPEGAPLELDLVDENGTRLPVFHDKAPAVTRQQTFIIQLDAAQTLSLAAGKYRAEAKIGAQSAAPLALEIIEKEPRTHFTTLLNGKYNVLGSGPHGYATAIKTGRGADELAGEITAMGYNAFMGMDYDLSRVYRHGLDLEQVVRERPELGPWESYYQPSGRDKFLNAAVRHNLRFYENLFTEHDATLPRDPIIVDACERFASLETASMRFSPAFRGVCLYDELYDSGDNDAPRSVIAGFGKAQEMAYRAKYPGMTSADAARALDRFTNRPAGQRNYEDIEKFRTWAAHQDNDWKIFSDRLAAAVKSIDPESQNWTLYRAWGSNGGSIATNGVPADVFGSLDVAATVMYKDGGTGDRPVFAPMLADILRVRPDIPVWTQIHNYHASGLYGAHLFRQTVFGLSQKIDGLSFFTIEHDPTLPDPLDNRDAVRNIAGALLTPYGDFFASLDKGYRKVAVFYSRESAQLGARKPNKLNFTAEGLWTACMRAGFPADFIDDPQMRAGKALDYDVVFAPGYAYEEEASPEILAALKRLVAAGKTVVVERSSKLPIEGIVRLDSELDEYDDKLGGAFPRYVDFETETVFNRSEEMTKLLRDFLSKRIKPAAEHNLIVGPDWLRKGQGEYMVLPNFAPLDLTGLHKTLYQAPDEPVLRFPRRSPFCYDVLEMRPQTVKTEGDWMTMQADLRVLAGKVFAFLPAAIDKVSLQATARVTAGADLTFQAAVASADGKPIDADFPLEITLRDGNGKMWLQVYRAAAPTFRLTWRVPLNGAPGQWKLRVRELISGAVSESTVDVTVPANPSLAGTLDARAVWVHDPGHIKDFLAPKAAAGATPPPEILIALDAEQPWCRPHAEKLAAALQARGRAARIVAVSDAVRVINDWGVTPVLDGGRLWRGELVEPGLAVDAPMILLGRRYENRLIEALARRDVLPEVVSAHFPAPGKAIVGWTRRAFSNVFDTLTILANDDAGLAAGIAALPEIAPPAGALPGMPPNAPAASPVPALAAATVSSSAPTTLRDALSGEDRIRALDVDPGTGRVLVGTFGFGDNLFCFAADGHLLWKQFLPEHNVYCARWFDEGRQVVAATGQGFFLFLLKGEDGAVLKKLAATEWPEFHHTYGLNLEGAMNTEVQIEVNAPLRQLLVRGLTGIMALDFAGRKMWFHDRAAAIAAYPQEAEQSAAAIFGQTVHIGNIALSPDGGKLVYSEEIIAGSTPGKKQGTKDNLWRHTPKVLDARTGQVLLQNEEDPGNQLEPGHWRVSWPGGSAAPWIHTEGVSAPLSIADNKIGTYTPEKGSALQDGSRVLATRNSLERADAAGRTLWHAPAAGTIWLPALDTMNPQQTRFYRCNRDGLVRCYDLANGQPLWEYKCPFNAVLHAFGDELVAGANNGAVVRLDASGKPVWQARLRDLHEVPAGNYNDYLAAARLREPDATPEFFPSGKDAPDDYKDSLRMGIEQLTHGDFEATQNWQAEQGTVTVGAPAKDGAAALQLAAGQLVTQRLSGRVIPSATYLLEFWYRLDDAKTRLTAGGMLDGAKPAFTGSKFGGRPGDWTFGRLAVKSYGDTRTLDIGFEAEGGHVSVDSASLRAVRFPSSNLLANAELQAVEQTYVKDIRVQYERIPAQLRERMMSRNRVSGFAQGITSTAMIYTQEAAFLQNGKLDDVGNTWTYAPDPMAFAVTLTKPSYISHLVLYMNNAEPDSVYPVMSILANNLETKVPQDVGLVRMNQRRFVLVNFPQPIFTDALKIIPGLYPAHKDALTEIEVYGPLDGGKLANQAAADPDAMPMLMGTAARVPAKLPSDLTGAWGEYGSGFRSGKYPAFAAGTTVVDGLFSLADPDGAIRSVFVPPTEGKKFARLVAGPIWPLATVTPTTTPARWRGRVLVGSADYKLHAIADNGTYLWSFATAGRIYSSPAPDKDDVFFGSDDGKLYKVAADSGILIWEFATGDKVRGAPALAGGRVFVASEDGFLYAVDAETGQLAWKATIAKYTVATPAILGDQVFIGDESGVLHCFDARGGQESWQQKLDGGGYISTCPVVTPEGVAIATEQGTLAFLDLAGAVKWQRPLGTGVSGQPIATATQLLVPTDKGLLVLRRADGLPDERFTASEPLAKKILSVVKWRDQLCMQEGFAWTDFSSPPRTYADLENNIFVWVPEKARGTMEPKK